MRQPSRECPTCDSELNYDEVDIGVGVQTGNYRCDNCGWTPEQEDAYLGSLVEDSEEETENCGDQVEGCST